MQGAEVGVNVEIEVEPACGAKDHALVSCSSEIPNNSLDCNGVRLLGLRVEATDLADGEGDVGMTVAGKVEEHPYDGGVAPGLAHGRTIGVRAKGQLGAGKEIWLALLKAGGKNDLVDETTLCESVFALVSLFELDAEELGEASFSREFESFRLKLGDKLVDGLGVFGSDTCIVDVQNNQHGVSVKEAGIKR